MNAIRSVFAAFTNLAASVNALASVLDAATGKLRQQLACEVIEHRPAVADADASDEPASATGKRGKAKGA